LSFILVPFEAPTHPSTPKVLQANEHAPTSFPSIVFNFRFVVESIKELGGAYKGTPKTLMPLIKVQKLDGNENPKGNSEGNQTTHL
jgi:hypothetical protein